jgi:hypothetical protein
VVLKAAPYALYNTPAAATDARRTRHRRPFRLAVGSRTCTSRPQTEGVFKASRERASPTPRVSGSERRAQRDSVFVASLRPSGGAIGASVETRASGDDRRSHTLLSA